MPNYNETHKANKKDYFYNKANRLSWCDIIILFTYLCIDIVFIAAISMFLWNYCIISAINQVFPEIHVNKIQYVNMLNITVFVWILFGKFVITNVELFMVLEENIINKLTDKIKALKNNSTRTLAVTPMFQPTQLYSTVDTYQQV